VCNFHHAKKTCALKRAQHAVDEDNRVSKENTLSYIQFLTWKKGVARKWAMFIEGFLLMKVFPTIHGIKVIFCVNIYI
jgi:hypothetical protein